MRGYHILANFCLCTCKSLIGGEADVYTFSLFKAVIKAVFKKIDFDNYKQDICFDY